MTLFQKIIVGVDAEGLAAPAIAAANGLRDRFDCELELVHGVELPGGGVADRLGRATDNGRLLREAHRAVSEQLESLDPPVTVGTSSSSTGVAPHLVVLSGRPADAICERASELDASLIVIGPHRDRGLRELLELGGTLLRLLVRAPAPVWIQRGAPVAIERVLAAVDLELGSTEVLELARDAAAALDVPVHVVHAFPPPAFAWPSVPPGTGEQESWSPEREYVFEDARAAAKSSLDELVSVLDWEGVTVDAESSSPHRATRSSARPRSSDLVVMGSAGRSGIAAALVGSVARSTVARAECPVLVIRRPGPDH